jgi:hypothetical protein
MVPADKVRGGSGYSKTTNEKYVEAEYDHVVLENAGCFLSTWETYQAQVEANETHERERAARAEAQREQEQRDDPRHRETLTQLEQKLQDRGWEIRREFLYNDERDDGPWRVYAIRENERTITLEPDYRHGMMLGTQVKNMDADLLIDLLG